MEASQYRTPRGRRRLALTAASMVVAGVAAFALYDGIASSPNATAGSDTNPASRVETIGDTGLKRVVLLPRAAKRLDIQTARVSRAVVAGEARTVIPYASVLYDANGATWIYTSPRPFQFVRHDIRVDDINGERAVLSAGPRAGTRIVTVGSAELWGIEYGDIEED